MEAPLQDAQGIGIAQAYGKGATAIVNFTGITLEQLKQALREERPAIVDSLSKQFDTPREAVRGFLKILGANEVPDEKLAQTLGEIAQRHRDMLQRLSALDPEAPETKAYIEQARTILSTAQTPEAYDRADLLLAEAEASDMGALREAEALEQEAKEAARRKRLSAAATRSERGELSLTRLDYLQAGQLFKGAADLVGQDEAELRADYLNRYAGALRKYGDEKGDNTVLEQAIGLYRTILVEVSREKSPQTWAKAQNNLGNALRMLGERESGTALLEEAVIACREALKEYRREQVPLEWAMTQNNLGNALGRLGAREGGTERLEQAVTAYREALKESTRERVPLQWAATQNNLGNALETLGERESGTARLEEAVGAYREALKERTREGVPLDWAATQNSLGNALRLLGERVGATARLEEAVTAIEAARTIFHTAGLVQYDSDFEQRLRSLRQLIAQTS